MVLSLHACNNIQASYTSHTSVGGELYSDRKHQDHQAFPEVSVYVDRPVCDT
uniref:Uncharacterized protein n=1 Tax=Arion vulgaris TaxID=1028688 RepID=A0A0B6Y5G1_9EUPU